MFFWNSLAFSMIQRMLDNLVSGSSAFSKTSLNIRKFTVHILLKPGLENFEHYFTSVWDECKCAVVWAFFGIAFLWDWNENWSFPVLHLLERYNHTHTHTHTHTLLRMWRKGQLCALLVGINLVQPWWKAWRCHTKLKIELLYDPAVPFKGV